MITVTLYRCPDGHIRRFRATGHAGYADPGQDIICAAITAIAATAIGSLQDLARLEPVFTNRDGLIDCLTPDPETMPAEQRLVARTLMESVSIGCRQIQNSYGKKYVRIKEAIFT